MSTASSVGLSSSWAEKVRNGEINIRTITDESLAEKIKEYQEWYLNNAHMFSNKYVNLV